LSKVTAKYQVTIPVKVRKEMGIVPGAEVDQEKVAWKIQGQADNNGIYG